MAYKNEEFDNVFQILDAIIYQTGCLNIVEKHSSSFNEEDRAKAEHLIAEQRENIDQLWNLYQSKINPIMQNLQSVGKDLDKFAKEIIIAGEKYDQASFGQQSVEENVASQTPAADAIVPPITTTNEETPVIKNDIPKEVAPVETGVVNSEKEQAVVETTNVPAKVSNETQASVGTNTSTEGTSDSDKKVQSNENETGNFILTPIEEDVVASSTDEKEQNVSEEVTVAEGVAVNSELTPEVKESILNRYIRMTTDSVKAILVTSAQYQKLSASRGAQKQLSESATSEVSTEVQPVVSDNADTVSAPTDKRKELQEMLEQANNLYKEGRIQESQELYAKVGAINKELQAQTSEGTNTEGNAFVKK